MSRSGWRRLSALIWIAVACTADAAEAAPAASLEQAIKATFLYKFAPFVQWPASAFPTPASPISICVLGTDPVSESLGQIAIAEMVGARPYQVRQINEVDRNSGCHILYAAGNSTQSSSNAIEAVRGAPVLTVTDSAQTPQASGIINFVIQQNRVRFDVDEAAAAENGLSISSRLLDLARTVRRRQ